MWVMSQYRNRLIKVESFHVRGCCLFSEDIRLGTFESEERALEVLQEIVDRLEDGMHLYEEDKEQTYKRAIIFEVPLF